MHAICSSCLRVFRVTVPEDAGSAEWGDESAQAPQDVGTQTAIEDVAVVEPVTPEPPAPEVPEPEPTQEDEPLPFEDLTSLASEALSEPDGVSDASTGTGGSLSSGASRFASRDPHDRARRLARVLVSDIIAYHPTRYRESLSRGSLKEDFEKEVKKSWKEYVDQVGEELAESTPYFDEALNEILAKGEDVF